MNILWSSKSQILILTFISFVTFNLSKYKFNYITLLPKNFKLWLPDLANKNSEHSDKFQFQMNNEYFFFFFKYKRVPCSIWDIFILKRKYLLIIWNSNLTGSLHFIWQLYFNYFFPDAPWMKNKFFVVSYVL